MRSGLIASSSAYGRGMFPWSGSVPWPEQHAIVSSDRRSFAHLATRFPAGLAGEFFLGMAKSEGLALDKLRGLADWAEPDRRRSTST